jgi:hypothetical protein
VWANGDETCIPVSQAENISFEVNAQMGRYLSSQYSAVQSAHDMENELSDGPEIVERRQVKEAILIK